MFSGPHPQQVGDVPPAPQTSQYDYPSFRPNTHIQRNMGTIAAHYHRTIPNYPQQSCQICHKYFEITDGPIRKYRCCHRPFHEECVQQLAASLASGGEALCPRCPFWRQEPGAMEAPDSREWFATRLACEREKGERPRGFRNRYRHLGESVWKMWRKLVPRKKSKLIDRTWS